MKSISGIFTGKEEARKRKPVELYHIWQGEGDNEHFYTSGDSSVTYDGDLYVPASIKRSLIRYDSQLEATSCTVQAGYIENPLFEYIAINPIDIYWIKIMKLFRDQDPYEVDVLFLGQIKSVSFKGIQADVECVGFEYFLAMPIPKERYQLTCNHTIYDARCQVIKEDYKVTAVIALDATKTVLTAAVFGTYPNGYFTGGVVEFVAGKEKRMIVAHSGTSVTIPYRMISLEDGNSVDVYPGCDGRAETCRDKFDNILNYLGFPFTPIENPVMRT
jgi:uncharacterized phage protein (TIGR02218 family)